MSWSGRWTSGTKATWCGPPTGPAKGSRAPPGGGGLWTLPTAPTVVTSGQNVAVPAGAALDLSFKVGDRSQSVQHSSAPDACPPQIPPSGSYTTVCTATGAKVVVGTLDSGTRSNVVWTLTYGDHHKVVTSGETVAVPAGAALDLSYKAGHETHSVQHGNAPYACPPEVPADGSYTTVCTATGASVVVGTLTSGSHDNVVWTLTYGDQHKVVSSGDTVPVPAGAALDLSYKAGNETHSVQHGKAPYACPPEVPADGSYTTVCTATGASVVVGTLTSGSHDNVVWTLTYGDQHKVVSSGDTVPVPAGAALDLSYKAGNETHSVQHGKAPDACPPAVQPSGSFTVVCSAAVPTSPSAGSAPARRVTSPGS